MSRSMYQIFGRCAGILCLLVWLPVAAGAPAAVLAGARASASTTTAVLATIPLGGNPVAEAVDSEHGRLYVAVLGPMNGAPPGAGSVLVFNSANGHLVRTVTVGAIPTAMSIAERAGRIFVVTVNRLIMLDAITGNVLKTSAIASASMSLAPWPLSGTTALAVDERDNRLFLLASTYVTSYNATTGTPLETVALGYTGAALAFDSTSGHLLVAGQQPPSPEHNLGHGACDQAQFCPNRASIFDGTSGRLLATTVLPGPRPGNPTPLGACGIGVDAALHRALIARMPEGRAAPSAVIVDTRSGKVLATLQQYYGGCMVQADEQNGRAFVLTSSNAYAPQTWDTLTIVNLQTGTRAGGVTPGGRIMALTLDELGQRVFVLGNSALGIPTVLVVDARSDTLLHSIPLSTTPWQVANSSPLVALAVDEQNGHLFAALPARGAGAPAALIMLNVAQ